MGPVEGGFKGVGVEREWDRGRRRKIDANRILRMLLWNFEGKR